MTILFSAASKRYNPQTVSPSINVPAGLSRLKITLTRENWPVGPVGTVHITRPDGTSGGDASYSGGDWFQKGVLQTTTDITIEEATQGVYTFDVVILQRINTAITIEGV